jgi:predicted SAM-dependent methyltransferase
MRWIVNLLKARTSPNLRRAVRDVRMELYLLRRHRAGVKRARQIARRKPLRLNLGSGFRPRPGWTNVDLSEGSDLALDLREPLPFDDRSVDAIYTEHFFEHLSYPNLDDSTAWDLETPSRPSEALTFLRECLRVLAPGGLLDIVVPDAEGMLAEYVGRRDEPFPMHLWWGPKWCDTPLHCVNYLFRQGREHKYAYDEETLQRVLEAVGFANVRRRPFNPAIDADNHAIGSLCMLATKPAREGAASRPADAPTANTGRAASELRTGTRG